MRPTVIGHGSQPTCSLAPTVVPGGVRAPVMGPTSIPGGAPAAPPATSSGPVSVSRMAGEERRVVAVTSEELKSVFPGVSEAVLEASRRFLSTVVLASLESDVCNKLAEAEQCQVAQLVSDSLHLFESEVIRGAPRHLARLMELLLAVGDSLSDGGLMLRWRDGPQERLDKVRPEMEQLRGLLEQALDRLAVLQQQQGKMLLQTDDVELTLSGAMLGCEYLMQESGKEQVKEALLDRANSLGRSISVLRDHRAVLQVNQQTLTELQRRIRDGVLIQLPAWLSLVARSDDRLNDTQRYVLRDSLADLLTQLK